MFEITNNLFIGNQDDYEFKVRGSNEWAVIHACKEPYHRNLLGYTGRGVLSIHTEYLLAERKNRLFLIIFNVKSLYYITKEIIDNRQKRYLNRKNRQTS